MRARTDLRSCRDSGDWFPKSDMSSCGAHRTKIDRDRAASTLTDHGSPTRNRAGADEAGQVSREAKMPAAIFRPKVLVDKNHKRLCFSQKRGHKMLRKLQTGSSLFDKKRAPDREIFDCGARDQVGFFGRAARNRVGFFIRGQQDSARDRVGFSGKAARNEVGIFRDGARDQVGFR